MSEIKLNTEQGGTITALSNFENTYVLKGYAGTGKTTVITYWVRAIRKRPDTTPPDEFWRAPSIVLTAPTNKATGVLRDKAEEIELPVDVCTIHSLLSLKLKWERSEQILVQDRYGSNNFQNYDYVVIDETSMLNEELMKYIRSAQEEAGNKIIFMGDPCQLPPIGEAESESFTESEDLSELTQVMRQARDNPIQGLALYLRGLILGVTRAYPSRIFEFVDDKSMLHLPVADNEDQILEAFADPSGDRDIRHVAWTNRVVDLWNDKIRDQIYGFDREEWTEGEAIVTIAPVLDRDERCVIFTTDTLLTIQKEPKPTERLDVPCWLLICRGRKLYVPMRDSSKVFAQKKEELLDAAKQDKKQWRHFYAFMELFARVKPAHSLTVHRSQGSTFDDVYVSYANILSNPNRKESLQCLYVATTRPRSRLILV